jgi:signal transduction histidine kinase
MKINYKQKIFFSYVIIFSFFALATIFFEQSREKKYKADALEEKLDAYANIVESAIIQQISLDRLLAILPHNIRLSIVDNQGGVTYDNVIKDVSKMENHADRPEIATARKNRKGTSIRTSTSNKNEYLYYAKQFNSHCVRVALPYDIQVRYFLKPDNYFLYYIVALFVITLFLINYATNHFRESIRKLKAFTNAAENNLLNRIDFHFPDDELGEIGVKIAEKYQQLKESEKIIALEREKLLQHVHSSEEGICFFSVNKTVEFYNGLFIRYLNTIVDEANGNPAVLFTDPSFEKVTAFFNTFEKQDIYFETKILKQGKTFAVRVNVFDNGSFEIIINDVTRQEKTRLLKQEMTGNITHELKTPVTGIRGCLETVLEQRLDAEKKQYFIQNAYNQVLLLSELIQDMSLITKIEDAPYTFHLERVGIRGLLEKLAKDMEIPMQEKNIRMECDVTDKVVVKGNRNLLYSIFRNLTDNAIRYAGNNVKIRISQYSEDTDFYYFSYLDTGVGISGEQHLTRLFERFYRINEGRTRDTGGSGLGLSIVKNAVLFHKGSIIAKNRATGGLEFLFNLPKAN